MDSIDSRLLALLQRDARQSNAVLADKVGLSGSACARRVARLWSDGFLSGLVAKLNRRRFPRPVSAAVMVTLSAPKSEITERFAASVSRLPEVLQCHAVTGDFDFLLIVQERSIEEYHDFAQSAFGSSSDVQAYKTVFLLRTHKNEDTLPDYCLKSDA